MLKLANKPFFPFCPYMIETAPSDRRGCIFCFVEEKQHFPTRVTKIHTGYLRCFGALGYFFITAALSIHSASFFQQAAAGYVVDMDVGAFWDIRCRYADFLAVFYN